MEAVWLVIALVFGLLAQRFALPPLVGFLTAGFMLHALGEQGSPVLEEIAQYGVLLLLFTIGLKVRPRSFLSPAIWAVTPVHMLTICLLVTVLLLLIATVISVSLDWQIALLIAFALSFSSTVLAVKVFEERRELRARHAVLAIGILIFQDLLAVIYLLFTADAPPTVWAFALILLPLARPLLLKLLSTVGHEELLVLFGITVTVLGAAVFELVGLKDGLGALVFGALLSNHPKSNELSRVLMGFKDFFLLGFFLTIGLAGYPLLSDLVYVALFVLVILPVKVALFFLLFTFLKLRARTAFLSAMGLATFSEFGLIVANEATEVGWLTDESLVVIALAVALSFVIAAVLNARPHELYRRYEKFLCRFESASVLPEDRPPEIGDAEVLVIGMGRVGRSAYRTMTETYGNKVCGVDVDIKRVAKLKKQNYNVVIGDAEDIDFWRTIVSSRLRLVMLSLPAHMDAMLATRWLKTVGYSGLIGAVTRYDEDRDALLEAGVDAAYNYYQEVGVGFADHVEQELSAGGVGLQAHD